MSDFDSMISVCLVTATDHSYFIMWRLLEYDLHVTSALILIRL